MRWVHIGLKDLRITTRDRGALGILLGMPMLLIVILGSALGNMQDNIGKIPVAIINLDKGDLGAKITDPFSTDERLTKLFLVSRMRDPLEARAAVERGDLAGALVVPAGFTRDIQTGKHARLMVYADPGRQITSSVFGGVTESLATISSAVVIAGRTSAFYAERAHTTDPSFVVVTVGKSQLSVTESSSVSAVELVESTAVRGTEISTLSYYAGAMSAMFIMFGAMFGAFSLIRERDTWTLARMMTTPAGRMEIIGGKMLGVFIVGVAQFGCLYLFTTAIGVKWGDPMAIGLLGASTVAAATGMSLLIAAVGKTVRSVSGIAQIVIQLMAALGGSFIPVTQFPSWMQPLHYLTVNGWAIDGFLETMRGGTALSVLPNTIVLFAMGAAFLAVGAMRLRWE